MSSKQRTCKKCNCYGRHMMSTDIFHPFNDSGIYACDKHKIEVWEETYGRKHPSKIDVHKNCIRKSVVSKIRKFVEDEHNSRADVIKKIDEIFGEETLEEHDKHCSFCKGSQKEKKVRL